MKYADARAEALALMRAWAAHQVAMGVPVRRVHRDLRDGLESVLHEFRIAHEVPGVRYWYISPGEEFVTTFANEPAPIRPPGTMVEQVERWFFLGKQHLNDADESI